MNAHVWWYVARASGYVAWALATASVIGGLLLSTRLTGRRPRPAWLLDLHRFLAGASVVFTGFHLGGLVADSYVPFGAADLLVPFASAWKPIPVALGIVALYLLAAIEVTSLFMRRLPRRIWKAIHLTSYGLFWAATFHMLTAGTDASNPVARVGALLAMVVVVFLTLVRILTDRSSRRRGGQVQVEHRAPVGAPRVDVVLDTARDVHVGTRPQVGANDPVVALQHPHVVVVDPVGVRTEVGTGLDGQHTRHRGGVPPQHAVRDATDGAERFDRECSEDRRRHDGRDGRWQGRLHDRSVRPPS
jgi:hypothetical protein